MSEHPQRTFAAQVGEIAEGKAKLLRFKGREVALFCKEGRYYALDNHCPHQGGPLGEGHIDGHSVICPWHHWDFHLETGKSRLGAEICVRTYPVIVEEGSIYLVDSAISLDSPNSPDSTVSDIKD